jgi:hypothetical protein
VRRISLVLVLGGPLLIGCGDDPFGPQDAVGVWDLEQFNGVAISGTSPTGVWIRGGGGSDSVLAVVESITLEFLEASACTWTFDDGIQGAVTEDDCQYAVSADGELSMSVGERSYQGLPTRVTMTLTDDDTNQLGFRKRT